VWPDVELGSVLSSGEDHVCDLPEEQRNCFLGLVPFKYEKIIEQQTALVAAELQKKVNSLFPREGYKLSKFVDSNRLWMGVGVVNSEGQMDETCPKVVDKLVDEYNRVVRIQKFGAFIAAPFPNSADVDSTASKAVYTVTIKASKD
jgi:hypothetical protein